MCIRGNRSILRSDLKIPHCGVGRTPQSRVTVSGFSGRWFAFGSLRFSSTPAKRSCPRAMPRAFATSTGSSTAFACAALRERHRVRGVVVDGTLNYATARSFFSVIPKRSSVPTFEVITFQSNQSMIRFCSVRSSHTNQAKQVLLGARGPCHP